MESKQIIMNFTVPPSLDDMAVIAQVSVENIPDELAEFCDSLSIEIEDFPDEVVEQEQELEDSYELMSLFKSGKELSPGVERKTANDDDLLILYRRSILDLWCEGGEDLATLIRSVIIEELGRHYDFSEEDIEEMSERHFQGMF